jgi:hypothetical protein
MIIRHEIATGMNIAALPLRKPRPSLVEMSISSPGSQARIISERRRYKNIIVIIPR